MPIYRKTKNKRNPFVMVDKAWIERPDLSAKAKGLLLYLLSKPDDWRVYESDILAHMAEGRDAVRSGLRELERAGYIIRIKQRAKGRFDGVRYIVTENPKRGSVTVDGKTVAGKSDTTNNNITKKERERKFDKLDKLDDTICTDATDRYIRYVEGLGGKLP